MKIKLNRVIQLTCLGIDFITNFLIDESRLSLMAKENNVFTD